MGTDNDKIVFDNHAVGNKTIRRTNAALDKADDAMNRNDAGQVTEGGRVRKLLIKEKARYSEKIDKVAAATASGAITAPTVTVSPVSGSTPIANPVAPARKVRAPKAPKVKDATPKAYTGPTESELHKAREKRKKAAIKARNRRKRIVNKIPKKHRIRRGLAAATLATGWYSWRAVRYSSIKTVKGVAATGRATGSVAKTTAAKRKWVSPLAGQKLFSTTFVCCGQSFDNAEASNQHFLTQHANEPRAWEAVGHQKPEAQLVTATTRRNSGKTVVLLPPAHLRAPTGRHRVAVKKDPALRADKLVAAYRDKITEIGVKAVADNGPSRNLAQAGRAWGDQRPLTLSEIREISAGFERAMLEIADAMQTLERYYNRKPESGTNGLNINPIVTQGPFREAREGLGQASAGMARFIALFEDAYAPYIRAKGELGVPTVNFAK